MSPSRSRRSSCSAWARRRHPRAPSISKGHRGTRGLRPENTLAAFGKALQIGVTTLELDTGVTKDGGRRRLARAADLVARVPGARYVGKLIQDLTYAQVQKLDCGTRHPADPSTDPFVGTQESVPGTHMPSLAQVFELVDRYGADRVQFDIETKIDPTAPRRHGRPDHVRQEGASTSSRATTIDQALGPSVLRLAHPRQAARQIEPRLRRVALAQATTIFPGTPWTGGIESTPIAFDGDLAARRGRQAPRPGPVGRLPRHHRQLIKASHQHGLDDHPVDGRRRRPTWRRDRPRRRRAHHRLPGQARDVMDAKRLDLPEQFESPFDVEGHRGGRRYRPENTLSVVTPTGSTTGSTRWSSTPA